MRIQGKLDPILLFFAFIIWLQSTFPISNMHYLKFRAIWNFFSGPFSIYGLLPYKMSRYLELWYLELFAIRNYFFGR